MIINNLNVKIHFIPTEETSNALLLDRDTKSVNEAMILAKLGGHLGLNLQSCLNNINRIQN